MDGGQQVKLLPLIGAVVNAARQPLFLKLGVHHSGPRLPPMFQRFWASPASSGNSVKEGYAVLLVRLVGGEVGNHVPAYKLFRNKLNLMLVLFQLDNSRIVLLL